MLRKIITPVIVWWLMSVAVAASVDGKSGTHNKPANWSQRKVVSFNELERNFDQPDMIYAPFAFWFWDAPLDAELAAGMAEEMCRQRMNPGYAHPRNGLPREQWLSPQWFESLDAALKKAEAANAYLGYCDEYWWPSGRADGRVLKAHPELAAISLKWEVRDVEGNTKVELPESFFTVAAQYTDVSVVENEEHDSLVKIRSDSLRIIGTGGAFVWDVPKGKWRVYSFKKYHHKGIDGSDVNYLDRRLPKVFIEIAHKPYADYFGGRMGKTIPGVFVDNEGDYGHKLAWSDDLEKEYKKNKGRDIRLWMPLLIDEDVEGLWARARWDWYDVVSDIYSDSFLGSVSRWLEERGMYDISNLWEENLVVQALAVGDFFKAQRAVSMPGNDCLVLWDYRVKAFEVHDFKEIQSVTEFEGCRFQSEVLGVAGWQMSPVLMKKAANAVVGWGVSHIVPHGVFLNRRLDTIPYPPDWYTCNPYWRYFHLWTDFARRSCYVNSHGHLAADVLLLNPMDSVWALLGGDIFDFNTPITFDDFYYGTASRMTGHGSTIDNIEKVYSKAINDLTDARIEYLIADRYYLRQMSVTPNGRLVRKQFEFKAIILPPMVILPLDVARKIVAFAEAGGCVYLLGELPQGSTDNGINDPKMKALMAKLNALPSVKKAPSGVPQLVSENAPFIKPKAVFESGEFQMIQLHRRIDGRDFIWLVNNTDRKQECALLFRNAKGLTSIWDCETGKITNIPSQPVSSGSRVRLTFKPYEAYWLVFDARKKPIKTDKPAQESWLTVAALDGPWNVRIDRSVQPPAAAPRLIAPDALLSEDGDTRPLASWLEWELDKFCGFVDYTTSFKLDVDNGQVVLDLGQVKHMAEVWVNEKSVGYRLWPPFEFDISNAIHKGRNHVQVRVGNLMVNAMKQYADEKKDSKVWGWTAPKKEDFDAGLFGPVIVRRKQ